MHLLTLLTIFRMFVLPVQFQDRELTTTPEQQQALVRQAQEYFNRQYTGTGQTFRFELGPTVTLRHSVSWYGSNFPDRKDTHLADAVREACKGRINLFSGVSGVGKSSLIKAIDPKLTNIRTGEISLAHLQGKHTTTFYEMHPISTGGFIIDTPGIRSFGLIDFEKEELSTYFPEMLAVMDDCRFKPCTHTHEPGCAVKQAVEDGTIAPERYNSYLGMLEDQTKYR